MRHCRSLSDGVIACGGTPTTADLAEIEKFKRYLRGDMNLAEAREYAGLSVGQVVKLLNGDATPGAVLRLVPRIAMDAATLRAIECGESPLTPTLRTRLEALYGSVRVRMEP